MKNPLLLATLLCASASAQIASEDFESGNPQGWSINGNLPIDFETIGGNPGSFIRMQGMGGYQAQSVTELPFDIVMPTSLFHPWDANFRDAGANNFRFDFRLPTGTSPTGAELILMFGCNNGTLDFGDDAFIVAPRYTVLLDSSWSTLEYSFDSQSQTMPSQWSGRTGSNSPYWYASPHQLWNAVLQDVNYIAIGVKPTTPFSVVDLDLDNLRVSNSNDIPITAYCDPHEFNSTGLPTGLTGFFGTGVGSDLHLSVFHAPPHQFGYFLVSFLADPAGVPVGDGRLCLNSGAFVTIGRYNHKGTVRNSIGQINASGYHENLSGTGLQGQGFNVPIDLPMSPGGSILTGSLRWHFQYWHRDTGAGAGHSNFSNGLSVQF